MCTREGRSHPLSPRLQRDTDASSEILREQVGYNDEQPTAIARASTKARTERSICFVVVAQSHTLIETRSLPTL
jgi:hypothetical protein